LPYPDTKYEGLVTTITDVAPIMNWVYIDRETHEAKYGVRADAQPNLTGPFDCTRQDRRLTFDGWEGWCAVEEYEGYWCLYFDVDDDGLKSKVPPGTRILEIELSRKEKRFQKETIARQQDQTTKREVDAQADAPIDRPIQTETEVKRPGVFNEPLPESEAMPTENAVPKTPPPAYSKSDRPISPLNSQRPRKGAVDALDAFLSLEDRGVTAPVPSTQPVSPAPQRSTLPNEKRVTPKLNRNSGTRAIAQAQMFEALAAAQINDNAVARRVSGDKRVSLASSNADSASIYSEEDQRMSREIRPQSSVSQRAYYPINMAPPIPIVQSVSQKATEENSSTRTFTSPMYREDTTRADPAVYEAAAFNSSKRISQVSSSSQRKRNSRVFTARRPGTRVSPRSSVRKSLTDTMSSRSGNASAASLKGTLRAQDRSNKKANRTQGGRKTTSTFLRDLDDLVSQEKAPELPKNDRKLPTSGRELPPRDEKNRGIGRADKRPIGRK
jgi:hypothetical protein